MSKLSKWHHYVPKGVLKRFCYSTPKIWYYSKTRKIEGVCSRDIGKKFRKLHYYSTEDLSGQRSDVLEKEFLQILDSRFSEFIDSFQRVHDEGRRPFIDQETRKFLQQFIYYYAKRNPDFEESLGFNQNPKSHVADAILEYEEKFGPLPIERKQDLLKVENVQSIYRYARVQSLARQSQNVNNRLNKMKLHFAFPQGKCSFVIGSNPVVRLENAKGAELGDGNVEIWTPLSPKILMGFAGPGSQYGQFAQIPSSQVRKINLQTVKQSTEIGAHSQQLLLSLLTSS